jgi:SAM-dependent methyltransferase
MRPSNATRPGPTVEGWRETYEQTDYRELPWFSPRPTPWVREAVADRWFPRGGRILDVGCGAGTNALFLAASGFRASGIDLAPGAIRAAQERARRRRLRLDLREANVLELPYAPGWFSGAVDIGCFHTLAIADRPRYVASLARVLRPGGRFALSCVAREQTSARGPPHRLALEEIVGAFEASFLVRRTEYRRAHRGRLTAYQLRLERRRHPQPPPR